jgi:hypothetical protein
MARVNRRPKRKASSYTSWHLHKLQFGHDYEFADHFSSVEEIRQAWEIIRDEILQDWIRMEPRYGSGRPGPGTRPWAWWEFDAPELIQRIDGKPHPFDNPERIEHVEKISQKYPRFAEHAYKTFFGRPGCLCIRDDFEAEFETPAAYLSRLGLWLPGEHELLP